MKVFDSKPTRRSVVTATGTLALTTLAGCSGGGGGSESGGGDPDGGGDTESGGEGGGGGRGVEAPDFDGWMGDVGNYESVADGTGSGEVSVSVGAEGNGGNFAFDPPVIRVSTGTTVVWEWTGQGAQHNVAAENADFESDLSQEEGYTFEHTFEEAGTYKYVCTPHRAMGMKGVVVVE